MFLVTRNGTEPVLPELMATISDLYKEFVTDRNALTGNMIRKLDDFMSQKREEQSTKVVPLIENTPTVVPTGERTSAADQTGSSETPQPSKE
jgi:hypothetical protein